MTEALWVSYIMSGLVILAVVAFLGLMHWLLIARNKTLGNEKKFPRQIGLLLATVFGLVMIVVSLPIEESLRNQIIGLIGLLVSGVIALSSTGIMSNLMAGVLLRITKPFQTGDFIRVGDTFGRVSERGLFDTEVQTETSELIALPNTYLIANPVTNTQTTGIIISGTISLGYDVHHNEVESLLIRAAKQCGLEEPFVHILELGNYSVVYRVSGFLTEVKKLITMRSNLYRAILDVLHDAGIEIMSPTVMNQRRIAEDEKIIPQFKRVKKTKEETIAEEVAFDKAEAAELLEKSRENLKQDIAQLEQQLATATSEEKTTIKETIEKNKTLIKELDMVTEESSLEKPSMERSSTK